MNGQRQPDGGSERGQEHDVALALGLVALVIAMIPAVQPLLSPELTCGYDNAFHLWRAVQIDRLWDAGILYSRWAPDMAHGFGFPLFVFASPFPPSLTALLHRLGLAWPVALNGTFLLGMVTGGLGMFWLARELFGRGAMRSGADVAVGVVAAVAYVWAPFQAYDVFYRGSLWESFAWAFPPLVLLGLHRWSQGGERRYLVLGAGALGAMILSHHVFAFLFAPVLVLWVVALTLRRRSWTVVARGALLGALGLGLTAFFWVPPLLERPLIQTGRLLGTWVFDYRFNFISLRHLLALPRRADPALINDWPEKALGLVPALVGLIPVVGWRRLRRDGRWQVGVLWVLVVGLALLTLPVSRWIWDRVALLAYVQFPWRYLGPAAFCLALLAGAATAVLFTIPSQSSDGSEGGCPRGRGLIVATLTVGLVWILIGANLGWFYPRHCAAVDNLSMAGMIAWERATDTLGTTAKGEYLPVWVERFPDVTLDEAYAAGGPIVRLPAGSLPEGAVVTSATYGALSATLEITSPEAFEARYLAFYYPGWRVEVDGASVPVAPAPEAGLLTFEVPAGSHRVEVRFSETPLRLGADIASAVTLVLTAWVCLRAGRRGRTATERQAWHLRQPLPGGVWHARAVALVLLGGALLLTVAKLAWVDRGSRLWRASRLTAEGVLSEVSVPLNANFGNQALLLGREALPKRFSADDVPVLTLYWRALQPTGQDWQVGLTLVGVDGSRWSVGLRSPRWARAALPVAEWSGDAYARMDFELEVPPGTPPGDYVMVLALFDRDTAVPASVLDASGNPVGPELALTSVVLARPDAPPTLAALGVEGAAPIATCGPVALWQVDVSHHQAAPGDLLTIETVWEAVEALPEAAGMHVALVDAGGAEVASWRVPPSASYWPLDAWERGDRWAGKAEIRLPGSLESGAFSLTLSLQGCDLTERPLEVVAPERRWTLPAGFNKAGATFGERARLAGYRLDATTAAPGETIGLTLAWEALQEMTTPYRIFVHLVGSDGSVVTQNDGEPVGWTRPTPGWAVGEIVVDPRPLTLPPGTAPGLYEIWAGLYGPDGTRLPVAGGGDAVLIGEIEVGS